MIYVPILKSSNDVSPPIIGKPCSCKDIDRCASLLTDDDPKLSLKAFAGPMSPKMVCNGFMLQCMMKSFYSLINFLKLLCTHTSC